MRLISPATLYPSKKPKLHADSQATGAERNLHSRRINSIQELVPFKGNMEPKQQHPNSFPVRKNHPIGIDKMMQLDLSTLAGEMGRLEDSIQRLVRSNEEMLEFEKENDQDLESSEVLKEARQENLETIACQKERVEMIKWTIQKKLQKPGRTSNSHYNQDHVPTMSQNNQTIDAQTGPTATERISIAVQAAELDSTRGMSLNPK